MHREAERGVESKGTWFFRPIGRSNCLSIGIDENTILIIIASFIFYISYVCPLGLKTSSKIGENQRSMGSML